MLLLITTLLGNRIKYKPSQNANPRYPHRYNNLIMTLLYYYSYTYTPLVIVSLRKRRYE